MTIFFTLIGTAHVCIVSSHKSTAVTCQADKHRCNNLICKILPHPSFKPTLYVINCYPAEEMSLLSFRSIMHWRAYHSSTGILKSVPPWRILFLGTDNFALNILKALHVDLIKR